MLPNQSDPPHQPLPAVPASKLARDLNQGGAKEPDKSPAKERNEARAKEDLGYISELRNSAAFQWFFSNVVLQPFEKVKTTYLAPETPAADLPNLRDQYVILRQIAGAMDAREITLRASADNNDPMIAELREKLALL